MTQPEPESTIAEHLEEFRWRLVAVLVPLTLSTAVLYAVSERLIRFLAAPLLRQHDLQLVFFAPTEAFLVRLKAALFASMVLLAPWALYQLSAFIGPGLRTQEKRLFHLLGVGSTVAFGAGVAIAFFLCLPPLLDLFFSQSASGIQGAVSADGYLSFIAILCLMCGGSLIIPALFFAAWRGGLLSRFGLGRTRRAAFLTACGLVAIFVPMNSMLPVLLVAAPWFVVFELVARLFRKVECVYENHKARVSQMVHRCGSGPQARSRP